MDSGRLWGILSGCLIKINAEAANLAVGYSWADVVDVVDVCGSSNPSPDALMRVLLEYVSVASFGLSVRAKGSVDLFWHNM